MYLLSATLLYPVATDLFCWVYGLNRCSTGHLCLQSNLHHRDCAVPDKSLGAGKRTLPAFALAQLLHITCLRQSTRLAGRNKQAEAKGAGGPEQEGEDKPDEQQNAGTRATICMSCEARNSEVQPAPRLALFCACNASQKVGLVDGGLQPVPLQGVGVGWGGGGMGGVGRRASKGAWFCRVGVQKCVQTKLSRPVSCHALRTSIPCMQEQGCKTAGAGGCCCLHAEACGQHAAGGAHLPAAGVHCAGELDDGGGGQEHVVPAAAGGAAMQAAFVSIESASVRRAEPAGLERRDAAASPACQLPAQPGRPPGTARPAPAHVLTRPTVKSV